MKTSARFYKILMYVVPVFMIFASLIVLFVGEIGSVSLIKSKDLNKAVTMETSEVSAEKQKQEQEKEQKSKIETTVAESNNKVDDRKVKEIDAVKPVMSMVNNYKDLYPDLYTERPEKQVILDKTVFLTFDDGPSERTPEILDILKKYNIKATFFVIGNTSTFAKECMKRIVDEGHTIAMHTYTHDFRKIYANVESYLEDINKIYNLVRETTGVAPSIFRFAGGSKNGFNKNNYREIISEMTRRGFDYFDWNLCTGDAARKGLVPANECTNNVLKYSIKYNSAVVLMHDSKPKTTTVEALPKIIEGLKEQGFSFEKLSNKIYPADFSLVKPYV